ncbi:MAG: glycosyltransferase [Hyphomicrobiaceae bacterium]
MSTARVLDCLEQRSDLSISQTWSGSAATLTEVNRRTLGKLWSFASLNSRLARWKLTRRNFEIVYVTLAPWTHAAIRDALVAWWGRRLGRRTLVHLHGEGLEQAIDGSSRRAHLMRALLRRTELIAITSGAAEAAARSGLFTRVHRLPNAAPDPGEPSPRSGSTLRIGFLGNLDPRKGVLDFVDAMDRLVRHGWTVQARIAGGSTPYLSVEALTSLVAEKGLAQTIDVAGPVHHEAKNAFLENLDLFLYPSTHDHAPLVLIEALSYGLVPIVRDTGGIAEIVGPDFAGNVLARHLEGDALTAAIETILEPYKDADHLLTQRRLARRRYLEHYTEAHFQRNLDSIVNSDTSSLDRSFGENDHPRVRSGLSPAVKSPFIQAARALHTRVATRPLPNRIAVYFHNLGNAEQEALRECAAAIRDLGYRFTTIGAGRADTSNAKLCSLSFDDNYRSWHSSLDLLDELGVKATFYVNSLPFRDTCRKDEIDNFFARIGFQGTDTTLARDELREIAARGHEIGCHSHSHFMLAALPRSHWDVEIRQSRLILEDIVGREVRHFAWPYGMPRHITGAQRTFCFEAGFASIAAATPCMLHRPPDAREIERQEWRTGRSRAQNVAELAIDGRLFTRLTGRSVVG